MNLLKLIPKLLPFVNAGTSTAPLLLLATFANDNATREVCFSYTQIFVVGLIIYALLEVNRRTPTRGQDNGGNPTQ